MNDRDRRSEPPLPTGPENSANVDKSTHVANSTGPRESTGPEKPVGPEKSAGRVQLVDSEMTVSPFMQSTQSTEAGEATIANTIDTGSSAAGGAALETPTSDRALAAGDTLGKYEIRKKLGQGGMGAVYLAFDPMIEREVAIKVLPQQFASQPNAIGRFQSEARATGKLNHPNVVAIYDIASEGGYYYIVMELVRGGSGAEFIVNRESLNWRRSCEIAADASDGLAAAHAEGLVHRDIKPENLMLTSDGAAKVVDFGLTKLIDSANESRLGLTGAGQILGTPRFMSPEQFEGRNVDARSDVYSMGATLYSLLTGSPPFSDTKNLVALMAAHATRPPPDPTEIDSEIPAACGRIVKKAMAKLPDQRYRDAGELSSALRAVLSGVDRSGQLDRPQSYRPLQSVVVVEPSRMQAMMLEGALKNAGASEIAICDSAAEALRRYQSEPPDLVITAMQLTDANGIELIRALRDDPQLPNAVLVINSSDPRIEQLVDIPQTGPLAAVSRKTKPDDLLRAIHSCTFLNTQLTARREVDAATLRFGFVCDVAKIPTPIATLIREANLLDVQVMTFDDLASGKQFSGLVDLVVALRTAGDATEDALIYTDLLARGNLDAKVLAAVQVDSERVTMRAAQCGGFTVISRCRLDDSRLRRLIQLCQLP